MAERRTRGKSRPGRLRLLDAWLVATERPLLERRGGPWARAAAVDLGFGAVPWTTREWAGALRAVRSDLEIIGVEIDPARVAGARQLQTPGLRFVEGGFDLRGLGPLRLVRAANVLRQYPPEAVAGAHRAMGAALLPGGLLLEGTTDRGGAVAVAHLLRRAEAGLTREGLLFTTDFSAGFAPAMFARYLPRDLQPGRRPEPAVAAVLAAWTEAWRTERGAPPALAFERSLATVRLESEGFAAVFAAPGALLLRTVEGT
jgi:hypothetical protein